VETELQVTSIVTCVDFVILAQKKFSTGFSGKMRAGSKSFQQFVGKSVESKKNQGVFTSFPQGKLPFSVENFFDFVGKRLRELSE
jgi:hypothetical protein